MPVQNYKSHPHRVPVSQILMLKYLSKNIKKTSLTTHNTHLIHIYAYLPSKTRFPAKTNRTENLLAV